MEHDPHTGFIVGSYIVATLVIVSMVVAIVSDYLSLRKSLKRFGAREADRG